MCVEAKACLLLIELEFFFYIKDVVFLRKTSAQCVER